jgi:hypothetical protein
MFKLRGTTKYISWMTFYLNVVFRKLRENHNTKFQTNLKCLTPVRAYRIQLTFFKWQHHFFLHNRVEYIFLSNFGIKSFL